MLPLIPPTTLSDLARDYRGGPRDTAPRFTIGDCPPAGRRPRVVITSNPVGALTRRIEAWMHARGERRFGTRIVSRSADRRSARTSEPSTRRAHDSFRDLDLAA